TVDGRADEYSLAVVGYRMITGELPYTGDSVHTILYKHIFEEVPSVAAKRSDAPQFLTAAISRALSKEPDQRFGTMEEFATAVWPEQPVAVPKSGDKTKSPRRPPPRPSRAATADAPTEVTTAPTTPIPRAGMRSPAAKKRASPPRPPPQASQPPAPPPVTVHEPSPTPPRRQTAPPPAPPPAVATARGSITVNSEPPGTVFIDGRDVGSVPVIEEPVSVGRHTIRVERPGYKTRTETEIGRA